MNEVAVMEVGREALIVVLKVAAPIMLAGLIVGLVIALFQALTTIQELTLTFAPKILTIFVAIIVFLPFMIRTVVEFGLKLFDRIATLS